MVRLIFILFLAGLLALTAMVGRSLAGGGSHPARAAVSPNKRNMTMLWNKREQARLELRNAVTNVKKAQEEVVQAQAARAKLRTDIADAREQLERSKTRCMQDISSAEKNVAFSAIWGLISGGSTNFQPLHELIKGDRWTTRADRYKEYQQLVRKYNDADASAAESRVRGASEALKVAKQGVINAQLMLENLEAD